MDYIRGLFGGFLLGITFCILFIYYALNWVLDPHKRITPMTKGDRPSALKASAPLSKDINKEAWPTALVDYIIKSLLPDMTADQKIPINKSKSDSSSDAYEWLSPTQDVAWLNVIATRFFLALRTSEAYKSKTCFKISSKMNANLKNNTFLTGLQILDLDLGDYAPRMMGVRLVKGSSEDTNHDLAVLSEIDIVYQGGASIAIEATITSGIKFQARIYLNEFAGKLRVRWPSVYYADMIGIGFVQDPGVTFTVDAPLTSKTNESVRSVINKLLASIARKVFLEMCVLPSWRTFFMPLMRPFDEQQARTVVKPPSTVPSLRSTLASKAATLWENRNPLLLLKPLDDVDFYQDHESLFSTSTNPKQMDAYELQDMSRNLISCFLELANSSISDTLESPSIWKFYKKKPGITMFKHVMAKSTEMCKSLLDISCDSNRVYSVLSNPEHFRHSTDNFVTFSNELSIDDETSVKSIKFSLNRLSRRDVHVLQVKKMISEDNFIVVYRSVDLNDSLESADEQELFQENDPGNEQQENEQDDEQVGIQQKTDRPQSPKQFKEIPKSNSFDCSIPSIPLIDNVDSVLTRRSVYEFKYESESVPLTRKNSPDRPQRRRSLSSSMDLVDISPPETKMSPSKRRYFESKTCSVYLYGYLIESTTPQSCKVTLLSSVSPDISKILSDISIGYKTKTFIEELLSLTNGTLEGSIKPDSRNIIKSYIGGAASYLLKNYSKRTDSPEEKSAELDSNEYVLDQVDGQSLDYQSLIPGFAGTEYVEREVGIKEIHEIPIDFDSAKYGSCDLELNWEFMSKTELAILFGIVFIPLDVSYTGHLTLSFDVNESGHWIIFPKCAVSAFSKPAFGKMSLVDFPKGTFIVTFDNSNKKNVYSLSTRCWIQDYAVESSTDTPMPCTTEVFGEVYIPRKSCIAFSFPFYKCYKKNEQDSRVYLEWNVSVGTDAQCIVFYQKFIKDLPKDSCTLLNNAPMDLHLSNTNANSSPLENTNTSSSTNTSKSKLSSLIGKAKDAYKEAKNVYKEVTSYPTNEIPLRTREAISSRLNNTSKGGVSPLVDGIDEATRVFTTNHPKALVIFPSTRINSKTHPNWKGSIDITKKYGVYTIVFDNLGSVVVGKSLSLDAGIK